MTKPSVFISYAHKDAMEFTSRLAFDLSMFMDVFWDKRLQSGPYPSQLFTEIENNDYFLLVMSPYSLGSDWCKEELRYAEYHKRDKIVLARLLADCHAPLQKQLEEKYTYGDFATDFDAGFRRITAMLLGEPFSSWEMYQHEHDETKLFGYVKIGCIPGTIIKELMEWVIVYKLWFPIEEYLIKAHMKGFGFFYGKPQTAAGVLREMQPLSSQFKQRKDVVGGNLIEESQPIVEMYLREIEDYQDDEHLCIGQSASEIFKQVQNTLQGWAIGDIAVIRTWQVRERFAFDVAEKLRALIKIYARRSRYLY